LTEERRLLCRLSLQWGIPQSEIENTCAASDVDEMFRFYSSEPFGAYRDNLHTGILASVIANVNRAPGGKKFLPQDFMVVDRVKRSSERVKGVVDFFKSIGRRANRKEHGSE
jgi:hypothetical protein